MKRIIQAAGVLFLMAGLAYCPGLSAQEGVRAVAAEHSKSPSQFVSAAVDTGDYVYVSGQGPRGADGSLPATTGAQVRQALENIQAIVAAAGLTMAKVADNSSTPLALSMVRKPRGVEKHKGGQLMVEGEPVTVTGAGNGPIAAFVHALQKDLTIDVEVIDYAEHAITAGSDASAVAYVEARSADGIKWGVGLDGSILAASLKAVLCAVNRLRGLQP